MFLNTISIDKIGSKDDQKLKITSLHSQEVTKKW